MAVHTFSTDINPALYVESAAVDVLSGATPIKVSPRPAVGTVVKVRNAVTLADLADTATTNNNGFLSFTTTDVPSVLISVNNWATSIGPFWSRESQPGSAGIVTATANGVATTNTAAANTTALNALHTAAASSGATILLPPGNIPVTTLTLLAPMTGAGQTKTTLVASGTVTVGGNDITLTSFGVKSANATALIAANRTNFTMRDLFIDFDPAVTVAHLGADLYNVDRARIYGCRFRIGGLQLSLCDDFLIDGNYVDCEYLNTNEPCQITGQSSGQFVNNTVYRTLTDALDLYSSGHYCVIAGNRFYGLRGPAGIECKVAMTDDVNNTSSLGNVFEATVISNNVLRDFNPPAGAATRMGIYAEYIDTRAAPVFAVAETNRAIIITGNVLEDFNVADPGAGNTIHYQGIVYTGHNGLVTNNVIRHMRSWQSAIPIGIKLAYPAGSKCVGVRVAGNIIAGVEGISGGAGIEAGSMDRCQIDGNIVRQDEVSGVAPKFGINFVAGAQVVDCSITGNTLECNVANSFGIRTASATALLSKCRIHGNTLRDCGVKVDVAQKCSFLGNVMDNGTNSQSFNVGVTGTSSQGNIFSGNHITMSSDYALNLTDLDGFVITGNSFSTTARAVLLNGVTKNGVIDNNISVAQASGTEFPHYSGVSATDQATIIVDSNNINGTPRTAVKTGTATLVAGTVTVADTAITVNSVIRVVGKTLGGTPGALFVSAKTAATNFVITSTNAADTSVVQYEIITY